MAKIIQTGDVARETIYTWLRDKKKLMSAMNYLFQTNRDAIEGDASGEFFFRLLAFCMDGGCDSHAYIEFMWRRFPKETRNKVNRFCLAVNDSWLAENGHERGNALVEHGTYELDDEIEDKADAVMESRKRRLKD